MWLKSSISKDFVRVDEFLNKASGILSMRPQNIDDIGESNVRHQNLFKEGEEVRTIEFIPFIYYNVFPRSVGRK